MKPAICFLFVGIILFTPVYNAAVWMNYELNQERITELFCINKTKSDSDCKGSCHVKETLIKDGSETSAKSKSEPPSINRSNLFFNEIEQAVAVSPSVHKQEILHPAPTRNGLPSGVFRPPIV